MLLSGGLGETLGLVLSPVQHVTVMHHLMEVRLVRADGSCPGERGSEASYLW